MPEWLQIATEDGFLFLLSAAAMPDDDLHVGGIRKSEKRKVAVRRLKRRGRR